MSSSRHMVGARRLARLGQTAFATSAIVALFLPACGGDSKGKNVAVISAGGTGGGSGSSGAGSGGKGGSSQGGSNVGTAGEGGASDGGQPNGGAGDGGEAGAGGDGGDGGDGSGGMSSGGISGNGNGGTSGDGGTTGGISGASNGGTSGNGGTTGGISGSGNGGSSGDGGTTGGISGSGNGGTGGDGGISGMGNGGTSGDGGTSGSGGTSADGGSAGSMTVGGMTGSGGAAGEAGASGEGGLGGAGGEGGSPAEGGMSGMGGEGGAGEEPMICNYCGDPNCGVCPTKPMIQTPFGSIDETEVSNAEYGEFLSAQLDPNFGDGFGRPPECAFNTSFQSPGWPPAILDNPVGNVDWCDAWGYCIWARKTLCDGAEWEAACSGEPPKLYPYGDTYLPTECNGADFSTTQDARIPIRTARATPNCEGGYPGLYDMSGNVTEWVDNCTGNAGATDSCAHAGGSFIASSNALLCSHENFSERQFAQPRIGFRCCGP